MRPSAAAAGCTVIDNSSLLPDGPGRAADRARGERRGDRRLSQEEHHRQPELLDRAAGGRAEAAARRREDQAGRRRDLSVGLGHRQGRRWTNCSSSRATSSSAIRTSRQVYPKQIAFNVIPQCRRLPRRRLDQGRMEDGGRDQEDPRSEDQGHRDLRARAGVRRPFSEAVNIEFENEISAPTRRSASCARRRASCWSISARTAATSPRSSASAIMRPYVSRIREDPTVENGLSPVGGQRQSAQGRGAERGPDRRAARPQASAESGLALGHVAPVAQQILLNELEPAEILGVHFQPFKRRDLVQFE